MKKMFCLKVNLLFVVLLLSAVLVPVSISYGQGFPQPVDDYVNDYAKVLNETDAALILEEFKRLEYETGIEAVVVTINSIGEYNTGDSTVEFFATRLFNTWGIGHKDNSGVLILLSKNDRKTRIEIGRGYEGRLNTVAKKIIDTKMVPYFKKGDYSTGLYEGSLAVIDKITRKVPWYVFYKWHMVIGFLALILAGAGFSCMKAGKKGWGWALLAAAGGLLLLLLKMFMSGESEDGFGGGESDGDGASGDW